MRFPEMSSCRYLLLFMCFFIDVAFQLNNGCRDRTVTALFLQSFQAGENALREQKLLILDGFDVRVLFFLFQIPFVDSEQNAEDDPKSGDDFGNCSDDFHSTSSVFENNDAFQGEHLVRCRQIIGSQKITAGNGDRGDAVNLAILKTENFLFKSDLGRSILEFDAPVFKQYG
nr:MAG TPA: hypothetical protein [Caudoviricetes sp.]